MLVRLSSHHTSRKPEDKCQEVSDNLLRSAHYRHKPRMFVNWVKRFGFANVCVHPPKGPDAASNVQVQTLQ